MVRADVERAVGRLMSSHEAGVAISSPSAVAAAAEEGAEDALL